MPNKLVEPIPAPIENSAKASALASPTILTFSIPDTSWTKSTSEKSVHCAMLTGLIVPLK